MFAGAGALQGASGLELNQGQWLRQGQVQGQEMASTAEVPILMAQIAQLEADKATFKSEIESQKKAIEEATTQHTKVV